MGNNKSKQTFQIDNCSNDILQSIFEYLSFVEQHRYRLVCRKWNKILTRIVNQRPYNWIDTTYGTYKLIMGTYIFIPTAPQLYNFKRERFRKRSLQKRYVKNMEIFTKYFVWYRTKLFVQIIEARLSKSLLSCLRDVKRVYICQDKGNFIMFMDLNYDADFLIGTENGRWFGESARWIDKEPNDIIEMYAENILGTVHEPEEDCYTHIFEYIVYVTQNWIYQQDV